MSAAGFIATSTSARSPGVVMSVAGELDLEGGHPVDRSGRGPDLGGEVRLRGQVVAEHGGRGREPVPRQLHPVSGIAGETDDDALFDFDGLGHPQTRAGRRAGLVAPSGRPRSCFRHIQRTALPGDHRRLRVDSASMRTRRLGASGPEISVIGYGAWEAGGADWGPNHSEHAVIEAIRAAFVCRYQSVHIVEDDDGFRGRRCAAGYAIVICCSTGMFADVVVGSDAVGWHLPRRRHHCRLEPSCAASAKRAVHAGDFRAADHQPGSTSPIATGGGRHRQIHEGCSDCNGRHRQIGRRAVRSRMSSTVDRYMSRLARTQPRALLKHRCDHGRARRVDAADGPPWRPAGR